MTLTCQNCKGDPLKKVNNEVKSMLRDMFNRKEINNKVRDYLLMKKSLLGKFYLSRKIHKRTSNVSGRHMIANNGTATASFNNTTCFGGHPRLLNQIETFKSNWWYTWKRFISFIWCGGFISHDQGVEIMWRFLDKSEDK